MDKQGISVLEPGALVQVVWHDKPYLAVIKEAL